MNEQDSHLMLWHLARRIRERRRALRKALRLGMPREITNYVRHQIANHLFAWQLLRWSIDNG